MRLLKNKLFIFTILAFAGFLVYSNSFHSPFQFDDNLYITSNPNVKNPHDIVTLWKSYPTRPVTMASFAANYRIRGLDTISYHIVNFVIHIFTSFLLWYFITLTFMTPEAKKYRIASYSYEIAFFSSLIFLCHPVQTECVTYIWQRAASLPALLYLLSLCLYIRSRIAWLDSGKKSVSVALYAASLAACFAAMFTKENTITLPVMIFLYELFFFAHDKKSGLKAVIPFLILLPIIPLVSVLTKTYNFVYAREAFGRELFTNYFTLSQPRVVVTYLRLLVLPVNLNVDYDYQITKSMLELPSIGSILLISFILFIGISLFRKNRLFSFFMLWFFLIILPEASIIPLEDIISEHRLYLPLAGYAVLLVITLYHFFREKKRALPILFLILLVLFYGSSAYVRNFAWKDGFSLWNDAVKKSPDKARPYYGRGLAYAAMGETDKAFRDYDKAIKLDPRCTIAYNNRGLLYYKNGDIIEAIKDFSKAIAIMPNSFKAYNNRGLAYVAAGDAGHAMTDFNKAVILNPYSSAGYSNRGIVYARTGEIAKAIADFSKAIEIDPLPAENYANRAIAYYNNKEYSRSLEDAAEAYKRGLNIYPLISKKRPAD